MLFFEVTREEGNRGSAYPWYLRDRKGRSCSGGGRGENFGSQVKEWPLYSQTRKGLEAPGKYQPITAAGKEEACGSRAWKRDEKKNGLTCKYTGGGKEKKGGGPKNGRGGGGSFGEGSRHPLGREIGKKDASLTTARKKKGKRNTSGLKNQLP